MANSLGTNLVVFSRTGSMPALLSHYRPQHPILCLCESEAVQRRLALYHGVTAVRMDFTDSPEETFDRALELLRDRGHVAGGQPVVLVQSGRNTIWRATSTHHIQTRLVPE